MSSTAFHRLSFKLPSFLLLLISVAAAAATGCAGTTKLGTLNYGDNARKAYAAALEEFYNDECLQAEPAFRNVKRLYPYTRFAALAELRVADCMYKQGKFTEAAQAYEGFAHYKPSHVEVPYARFMVALCNYEQIPSDWFITPPAYEREQRSTHDTLRLLRRFIIDHPNDPLVARAQRMAKRAVRLLAAHELYVARFYLSGDHPIAAIGRLRTLITTYPTSGYEPEALLLLGEIYLDMRDPEQAKLAFREVTQRYPNSKYLSDAKRHLAQLGG
jgi:outer membrane protein assembly factor BamD